MRKSKSLFSYIFYERAVLVKVLEEKTVEIQNAMWYNEH